MTKEGERIYCLEANICFDYEDNKGQQRLNLIDRTGAQRKLRKLLH